MCLKKFLFCCLHCFWWDIFCHSYLYSSVYEWPFSLAAFKIYLSIIGFKQFYYDVLWCSSTPPHPPPVFLVLGICWVFWIYGFIVFMKFGTFQPLFLQILFLFSLPMLWSGNSIKAVSWNNHRAHLFGSLFSGIAALCCLMSSVLTILIYSCFKQEGKLGPCYSNLTGSASQILLTLPRNSVLTHFKILTFV